MTRGRRTLGLLLFLAGIASVLVFVTRGEQREAEILRPQLPVEEPIAPPLTRASDGEHGDVDETVENDVDATRVSAANGTPSADAASQPASPPADKVTFAGRVVAEEDATPIAGARIRLFGADAWSRRRSKTRAAGLSEEELPSATATLTSDEQGDFAIAEPIGASRQLRIDAPGRTLMILPANDGHRDDGTRRIVRLRRAALVDVYVFDEKGPRPGIAVRWSTRGEDLEDTELEGRDLAGDPAWQATTGADGIARFDALASRASLDLELVVDGSATDKEHGALVLAPGEHRRIERSIGGVENVRGRVVDAREQPASGRTMQIARTGPDGAWSLSQGLSWLGDPPFKKTKTREDGTFGFEDVPPGEWMVLPGPADSKDAAARRHVQALPQPVHVPETGTVDVVVRLVDGVMLVGVVLDADGLPAADSTVTARAPAGSAFSAAQSDANGWFAIGPLPAIEHEVRAFAAQSGGASSEKVRALAGGGEVVLRLRRTGALACSFVDESGEQCGANGVVLPADGSFEGGRNVRTSLPPEGDGTHVVEGLAPGEYSLYGYASKNRSALVSGIEVRAGETSSVRVVLRPGAMLSVRAECEQGGAWYAVDLEGVPLFVGRVRCGLRSVRRVPAGRIGVRRFDGLLPAGEVETIDIAPGERGEIVLNLR